MPIMLQTNVHNVVVKQLFISIIKKKKQKLRNGKGPGSRKRFFGSKNGMIWGRGVGGDNNFRTL